MIDLTELSFIETSINDEFILNCYKKLDVEVDASVKIELPDVVFAENIDSIPNPGSMFYLIEIDKQPIGFLEISFESMYITNMIYLMNLYVIPEYRRMGVGTTAIDFLKTGIKTNSDIKYISVHCFEYNKSFYEKNGFTSEVWLTRICPVNK